VGERFSNVAAAVEVQSVMRGERGGVSIGCGRSWAALAGTGLVICLLFFGTPAAVLIASAASSVPSPLPTAAPAAGAARAPSCSTAVASSPPLSGASTSYAVVDGSPFGVAVVGDDAVVGAVQDLAVFSLGSFTPKLEGVVGVPEPALGVAATQNGRYLVAADEAGGADVVRLTRTATGTLSGTALGTLDSGGSGATELALSPDGRYAFVSLEDSGQIAVFDLAQALTRGLGSAGLVGYVRVNPYPVGLAVSPDGRYLYATSELQPGSSEGALATIDLAQAEVDPSHAVVSTVAAGCSPVRVIATGRRVYVTARGSDAVLSFSASALVNHPSQALQGWARVGEAPVGLVWLKDHGGVLVVADSNRFDTPGKTADLAVLDVPAGGRMHLAGYVAVPSAGSFPRDMAVNLRDGDVLVCNFNSGQLEAVRLPD
jgi:DNA-binding beta-propeller fold protein YncE